MKSVINNRSLKLALVLVVLFFYLGCKKKHSCEDVIQDDFELVE